MQKLKWILFLISDYFLFLPLYVRGKVSFISFTNSGEQKPKLCLYKRNKLPKAKVGKIIQEAKKEKEVLWKIRALIKGLEYRENTRYRWEAEIWSGKVVDRFNTLRSIRKKCLTPFWILLQHCIFCFVFFSSEYRKYY